MSDGEPIEILLPFYGDPVLLREAVDSVLAQDDPGWRLTVVDDAYPDPEAAAWVGELDDPRVAYLRHETNRGVSGSFQHCLDLATKAWVVIMGGDDRMLPTFVARMREAISAHPTVAFVQPGVRIIDGSGRPARPLADRFKSHLRFDVREPTVFGAQQMTESLLRGNWMYFPATCWRREVIVRHGFEPRYEVVLDWMLQLHVLQEGGSVLLDPEVTFEYRRHAASVSSWTAHDSSRFQEEKNLVLDIRELTRARGWSRASRIAGLHLSSRLHALQRLPAVLRSRDRRGTANLLTHVLTNRRPPVRATKSS